MLILMVVAIHPLRVYNNHLTHLRSDRHYHVIVIIIVNAVTVVAEVAA
jgi:hypothetical protein